MKRHSKHTQLTTVASGISVSVTGEQDPVVTKAEL